MKPVIQRRLQVLVNHAEPLLHIGLAAALRQEADFDVSVGAPGTEPVADVVVTDYETALDLVGSAPPAGFGGGARAARILVVTAADRENDVRLALERGVNGYQLLGSPVEEVAGGVRALGRGIPYLCPSAAQRMAESLTRHALTPRESDVLRLLACGRSNKLISRDLDITLGTVKSHVKAILGKLHAGCRTEAASIAVQRGLVAPSVWPEALRTGAASVARRRPAPAGVPALSA